MVMNILRKIQSGILICLLFVLLFPYETSAHGGRTDSSGGHKKTANGTYHCHSGQCLEDAKQREYDYYFPLGQEDGLTGTDQTEEIRVWIYNKLDSDQSEYIVPYALQAYKAGYEDTYVPTFWDKYGKTISVVLIVLGLFVGWMLLGFILIGLKYFLEKLLLYKKDPPIQP